MATQYYADADASGKILGFYNDDIWDVNKIPKTASKITEAQWQDCIANNGKYHMQAGALVLAPAPTTAQLLANAQADKMTELKDKCRKTVMGTFTSSALGVAHTYDFDYEAQLNLSAEYADVNADATVTVKWKTVDAGDIIHNATQIKQLFKDGKAWKQSNVDKYRNLRDQVNAATTVAQVQAIVWT